MPGSAKPYLGWLPEGTAGYKTSKFSLGKGDMLRGKNLHNMHQNAIQGNRYVTLHLLNIHVISNIVNLRLSMSIILADTWNKVITKLKEGIIHQGPSFHWPIGPCFMERTCLGIMSNIQTWVTMMYRKHFKPILSCCLTLVAKNAISGAGSSTYDSKSLLDISLANILGWPICKMRTKHRHIEFKVQCQKSQPPIC